MASSKAPCMQGARTLPSLIKFGFTCTAKIKEPELAACNKGDTIGDIGMLRPLKYQMEPMPLPL